MEENVLTDDELYAEILKNREKKRNKTGKIVSAVALALTAVIALVFILLAVIPTCYAPRFLQIGADEIRYNETGISTTSGEPYPDTSDAYNEILADIKDAFTENTLKGMFTGRTSNFEISTVGNSEFKSTNSTFTNMSNVVVYVFEDSQYFCDNSGNVIYSNSSVSKKYKIVYKELFFCLSSEDELGDLQVYVVYQLEKEDGTLENTDKSYYTTITIKANTYNLYNKFTNNEYRTK